MRKSVTPETIDALLPQTQCGLCGYGGCMPYAQALVSENAPINLCPPGGVTGLKKIAALLQEDASPFIAEMVAKEKPPLVAIIREEECIGCTKCIQACPVDAILGSAKSMHTILPVECTGCELCITPCPVDCIDLVTIEPDAEPIKAAKANHYRERFQAREKRLQTIPAPIAKPLTLDKKTLIAQAIARSKQQKVSS